MDRPEQIRRLLITLNADQFEYTNDSTTTRHQGSAALRGSSGSSSSKHQAVTKAQAAVDERLRYLKARHGGRLPAFDDRRPDPGCRVEARRYRQLLRPVPQLDRIGLNDDLEHPQIRQMLEEAREAHWKLTAPKGFAALKGIPELQQLLAYTAADVVQYAVGNAKHGGVGSFDTLGQRRSDPDVDEVFPMSQLCNEYSLIGQLCPGLRLCLAAEVATGLMCDSQPPPPDTPEHASALLLFLAAALKQVEQEQEPEASEGLGWLQGSEGQPMAMRAVVDFCLCPQPTLLLRQLQQLARQSAERRRPGSSSSSAADGSTTASVGPAAAEQDVYDGNIMFAALEVAEYLRGVAGGSSGSSASSSGGSRSESSSSAGSGCSSGGGSGSSMWDMLHKLRGSMQQHAEPQQHQGSVEAQSQTHVQADARQDSNAAQLVEYVLSLLDDWADKLPKEVLLQRQQAQQAGSTAPAADSAAAAAADPATDAPAADPAAAAAADPAADAAGADSAADVAAELSAAAAAASSCAPCTSVSKPACTVAGEHSTGTCAECLVSARIAAAQAAAWPISVLTGAAALLCMMPHATAAATDAGRSPDVCPARAALLFSAIEGMYYAVLEELYSASSLARTPRCTCSTCAPLLPLQPGNVDLDATSRSKHAKAEIVKSILQLLQLGHQLSSSSGGGGSSSAEPVDSSGLREQRGPKLKAMVRAVASIPNPGFRDAVGLICSVRARQERSEAPAAWLDGMFPQQQSPLCLQSRSPSAAAAAGEFSTAPPADEQVERVHAQVLEWQRTVNEYGLELAGTTLQRAIDQLAGGSSSSPAVKNPGPRDANEQRQEQALVAPVNVLADLIEAGYSRQIAGVMGPIAGWQSTWLELAESVGFISRHSISRAEDESPAQYDKAAGKGLRKRKVPQQPEQGREVSALRQALLAAGLATDSSDSSSEDADDAVPGADDAAAAAAGGRGVAAAPAGDMDSPSRPRADRHHHGGRSNSKSKSRASSKHSSSTTSRQPAECLACAAEAAAAELLSACGLSSSSSPQAAAGLYGALPVSWSDPYMMRRLLWDLLGKLKPTAQAWFRQYAHVCPHSRISVVWRMVVLSLARHIWAPPGEWGLAEERQMQLLLPKAVTRLFKTDDDEAEDAPDRIAAVGHYARLLNFASQQTSVRGSAAAVLSRLVLLALDPHGARVQPRPELLFYTPAGFHAAVCKVLLQSYQLPPAHGAAAAAGNRDGQHVDASQQQQQQLNGQVVQTSYLQAWSDVQFPAWYVWWHIGLLAYHQQQQQQRSGKHSLQQPGQAQPANNNGLGSSEDQAQQQEQQQLPGGRPKQLSKNTRLITARSGSAELPGGADCSSPQTPAALTPPAAPETPALLPPALPAGVLGSAPQGLDRTHSGFSDGGERCCRRSSSGNDAGSSNCVNDSSGSSSSSPVCAISMQELYNSPEARLFAVGYATRQISSCAQLAYLMSNPPLPWGLQTQVSDWVASCPLVVPGRATCCVCQDTLAKQDQDADIFFCHNCEALSCSSKCSAQHQAQDGCECVQDPAYAATLNHRWRILDLMSPSPHQQLQQVRAGCDPPPAPDFCIPPALNDVLMQTMSLWHQVLIAELQTQAHQQQQQAQQQAGSPQQCLDQAAQQQASNAAKCSSTLPLFTMYSSMYKEVAKPAESQGLSAAAAASATAAAQPAAGNAGGPADAADAREAAVVRQLVGSSRAKDVPTALLGADPTLQGMAAEGWKIHVDEVGNIIMRRPPPKPSDVDTRSESRSSSAQIEELKPQEGQQEQQEQAPQQQDVAQQQQDAEQGIEQEGDAALQQKQFGGGKLQQVTLQLRQLPGLSGLVAADKADAVAAADHRSASESLSASTPNLTPGPQRRQPDADSE